MKKILSILFIATFFLIQGCSFLMSRTVAVDSYAVADISGSSYYLVNETESFQLQNSEFSSEVAKTLNNLGYRRVFNSQDAKYVVEFKHTVKGPFQGAEPYLVQPNPWWGMDGFGYMEEPFYYSAAWSQGIAYYTYYVQELFISALDKNNEPVWQVQGSIKTEAGDPRESFPYILKAVSEYIDKNSKEVIYVNVAPNELNR